MAIRATVSKRVDTSGEAYPAPSHVNVAAEAASIARQYREFYTNPDSMVHLTAEKKAALMAEVTKTITSMPDCDYDENWVKANFETPDKIRLGDNPLFDAK